jgi:2-methylcitrate dehydratase
MIGATAEQIESAIGMVVAHAIPFRAIRAGKQLSDSKGSSAAISTEFAITAVKRSMAGFLGPRDIFRNPEAIFRIFEGPGQMFKAVNAPTRQHRAGRRRRPSTSTSACRRRLRRHGHALQAGPLRAPVRRRDPGRDRPDRQGPALLDDANGSNIRPSRSSPTSPPSASSATPPSATPPPASPPTTPWSTSSPRCCARPSTNGPTGRDLRWNDLMLEPADYSPRRDQRRRTRAIMDKIEFAHGGDDYDSKYPDGIPTSVVITDTDGTDARLGPGHVPRRPRPQHHRRPRRRARPQVPLLGKLAFDDPTPIIDRYPG